MITFIPLYLQVFQDFAYNPIHRQRKATHFQCNKQFCKFFAQQVKETFPAALIKTVQQQPFRGNPPIVR
jgi:hypothetical protein